MHPSPLCRRACPAFTARQGVVDRLRRENEIENRPKRSGLPSMLVIHATTGLVAADRVLSIQAKAMELRDRGFTVISHPCVDASLLEHASHRSCRLLQEKLDDVESLGCDPCEQGYAFRDSMWSPRMRAFELRTTLLCPLRSTKLCTYSVLSRLSSNAGEQERFRFSPAYAFEQSATVPAFAGTFRPRRSTAPSWPAQWRPSHPS